MPSPQCSQGPNQTRPSHPHRIRCSHAKLPGWRGNTASSYVKGDGIAGEGEKELRVSKYEGKRAVPDIADRTASNLQLSLSYKYILDAYSIPNTCPEAGHTAVNRKKDPSPYRTDILATS